MRNFFYHAPETAEEVLALLEKHRDDARLIAGGTAMINLMKQNLIGSDHIIDITHIPQMDSITLQKNEVHIGALTTHHALETDDIIQNHLPFIRDVYQKVATIRVRNAATVGGGLVHADPAQDPPPALIILEAYVKLLSPQGTRFLSVSELFLDYYESALDPNELLTELIIPIPSQGIKSTYLKFLPKTQDDYATISVAALGLMENGTCTHVKMALAGVGSIPIKATKAEEALLGKEITSALIQEASETLVEEIDPLSDFRGSAEYKSDMAVVFARRALEQVLEPSQ